MPDDNQPSAEQLRDARRAGFADSVAILPDEQQQRMTTSYHTQDDRRDRNISNFRDTVLGSDK